MLPPGRGRAGLVFADKWWRSHALTCGAPRSLYRPGVARLPIDPHEWISFEDEDEERTWVFDATFLTSNWTCIFGNGCQGVLTGPAPELVQGCCSYGAHLVDKKDAGGWRRRQPRLPPRNGRTTGAKKGVIHTNKTARP